MAVMADTKLVIRKKIKWNLKANWMLYLMLAPAVIATILFMYVPIYGVVIAFQDYNPGIRIYRISLGRIQVVQICISDA